MKEFAGQFRHRHRHRRRLRTAKIARLPPLPISLSSDGTETIGYEVFVVGNLELKLKRKMTPL